jgi:DNA-directed RNA polymerase beta' subunit
LTQKTRSLPYFEPNSTDIEAGGFITESFLRGCNPAGFIYHMMASRVGLMDTSLKTADIGHMHHRMVKVLEDLTVHYDGSVRNANGVIFSYAYGGDGFSAAEVLTTNSAALGSVLSFIDLPATVGKLNAMNGY